METGILLFSWAVGATFGALWTSLLEQGYQKRAKIYGFSMVYCYVVGAVFIQLCGHIRYRWLLLMYLLAALSLIAILFIYRRRRNRP